MRSRLHSILFGRDLLLHNATADEVLGMFWREFREYGWIFEKRPLSIYKEVSVFVSGLKYYTYKGLCRLKLVSSQILKELPNIIMTSYKNVQCETDSSKIRKYIGILIWMHSLISSLDNILDRNLCFNRNTFKNVWISVIPLRNLMKIFPIRGVKWVL